MTSDRRWSKFWWEDYEGDPLLSSCSLAAQGLWMRMLCLMHRGTPYGHLVINGKSPSNRLLASIVRCSERELGRLIEELEEHGVFSRLENGTVFSRRMVKDAERSEEGREAVAKRWGSRGNGGNGCRDPNRSPDREASSQPNTEHVGDQLHQEARSKKQEAREERTSSLRSDGPPSVPPEPLDARTELWRAGKTLVRQLTGCTEGGAGKFIGQWLKLTEDDCSMLLAVLRDAENARPFEAVPWIVKAIQRRRSQSPQRGMLDGLRSDWGLGTFLAPLAHDEPDEGETPRLLQ